jgi:hypothetical protein
MANQTYESTRPAIDEAFEILRKTGALRPRELPPSPILVSTTNAIGNLWQRWDDRQANELAAGSLFQDKPAEERRNEIEELKADAGACQPPGEIRPENLLRGTFRISCEKGFVDVNFTLAPTMPPKVQHLSFTLARTLQAGVKQTADGLAALIGAASQERASDLAASAPDAQALREDLEALRHSYGTCRLAETLGGNGNTDVRVRFDCAGGPLDVRLRANKQGKLLEASFTRPSEVPCAP